jgi:hypothetical protein
VYHRLVPATVWTASRKWMGNLIPALFWIVPTLAGIRFILTTHNLMGVGLWFLILGDVLGWLALNQFGLYQNSRMKRRLLAILGKGGQLSDDRIFVGFSSPKYTGVLDAHEDVGFLCFEQDEVAFISETRRLNIKKEEIERVQFRPNVHSMVGLGRWISIEGVRNKTAIRMLVEPREKRTMAGNFLLGNKVRTKIRLWSQR